MQTLSQQFQQSIRNGTGKAILLLKENPNLNVDEHILHACTHNLAYDPQCEESRGEYLFEIINLSHEPQRIIDTVLEQLQSPQSTDWHLDQLVNIARAIAQSKSDSKLAAIKAIFVRYKKNLDPDYENIFSSPLIDIGKLKGLEFVAEIDGKMLSLDDSHCVDDSDIDYFEERFPNSSPRKHLETLATENTDIKNYLNSIDETLKNRSRNKSKRHDFSIIQLLCRIDSNLGFSPFAGKKLSENDIKMVNELVDPEQDDDRLLAYLRLLSNVETALEISNILPALNSQNERSRFCARKILSKTTDTRVRELIDRNTDNIPYLRDNLELYISNFTPSDLPVITTLAKSLSDSDVDDYDKHHFIYTMRELIYQNPEHDFSEPLWLLNLVNNCSICRESLLKTHLSNHTLDTHLLEEMKYDCEPDIRNLAYTATSTT